MSRHSGLNPRFIMRKNFPNWRKPTPIGYFSVNSCGFYEEGYENLRYFRYPEQFPLDLGEKPQVSNKKSISPMAEDFDRLTFFIMNHYGNMLNKPLPQNGQRLFPFEFVGWASVFRRIMCTPFEYKQNWIINVSRYKGIFYLSLEITEESRQAQLEPMQRRMASWAYKFEEFCTTKGPDDPAVPHPENKSLDECLEFDCVFSTELNGFNLLYGAKIDGIQNTQPVHKGLGLPLEELELVQLQTCLDHVTQTELHSFLYHQSRDWWCQAFLIGIENIIVGWRDGKGLVSTVEPLRVSALPKAAKNWSPEACAWFLLSFLNFLKIKMANVDSPYMVYQFQYDAGNSLIMYEIFEGFTEKTFISDFYIEFIEDLSKPKP